MPSEPTIYLDYNATAPLKPAVLTAMREALALTGNASSVHQFGRAARQRVETARAQVAALAGVKPIQVIFTGGGTEANILALRGTKSPQIITSTIEHESVLANAPEALRLPVDGTGRVDLAAAKTVLREAPQGSLVSIMLVNNETGVIQPMTELTQIAKTYGHLVYTDAVQAAGRLPLDFARLGVDALSLSAHKLGGPQGVGALIVAETLPLSAEHRGGGQEMGRRAGTENVAAIVGFGVAATLVEEDISRTPVWAAWRDRLQSELLRIAGGCAVALGAGAPRVANTLCIAMRGVGSETQVAAMDLAGVAVSAGSACSSGKVRLSPVARAMGFEADIAGSTLRLSLGWKTAAEDVERAIDAWRALFERACPLQSRAA